MLTRPIRDERRNNRLTVQPHSRASRLCFVYRPKIFHTICCGNSTQLIPPWINAARNVAAVPVLVPPLHGDDAAGSIGWGSFAQRGNTTTRRRRLQHGGQVKTPER
jgi:hypothetical protein